MARVKVSRRTKSGKRITYYQNRKPGRSQSRKQVASGGLAWGGRRFSSRQQFGAWLKSHGSSLKSFEAKHKAAAAGLRDRGAKGRNVKKVKIGRVGSSITKSRKSASSRRNRRSKAGFKEERSNIGGEQFG